MSAQGQSGYAELAALPPRTKYVPVATIEHEVDDVAVFCDPSDPGASKDQAASDRSGLSRIARCRQRYLLTAWRLMLGSGVLAGTVVLLINVITLIVIYAAYDVVDHTATIWTGNCTTAARTVTGLHLFINILGTVLLASSNFSMQCLGSPTREEVDRAHGRRKWLSIGKSNIRNLFFVSRDKTLLWLLLGLNSFPLHIIWNTTVFVIPATNEYVAVSATESFVQGASWNLTLLNENLTTAVQDLQHVAMGSSLEHLEIADCIRAYGQNLQRTRRNLIMVVNAPNTKDSGSTLAVYFNRFNVDTSTTFSWMCGANVSREEADGCDTQYLKHYAADHADEWVPGAANDEFFVETAQM